MSPTPFDEDDGGLTRRRFLEGSALVPIVFVVGACGGDEDGGARASATTGAAAGAGTGASTPLSAEGAAEAGVLQATPACDDGDDDATEAQTEGPYYTPNTPRRSNLVIGGLRGTPLLVTGDVVDTQCRPVRGALLDFWQADAAGAYDNQGYRLRGHQFADTRGRYALRTIVPGLYPGRTRHIHVKVQRPHGKVLTTQLYFPGEPRNQSDGIFDSSLLMSIRRAGTGRRARFRFVLS
jgi:protocatechuate 3,4-dioxygenase beta subunit